MLNEGVTFLSLRIREPFLINTYDKRKKRLQLQNLHHSQHEDIKDTTQEINMTLYALHFRQHVVCVADSQSVSKHCVFSAIFSQKYTLYEAQASCEKSSSPPCWILTAVPGQPHKVTLFSSYSIIYYKYL